MSYNFNIQNSSRTYDKYSQGRRQADRVRSYATNDEFRLSDDAVKRRRQRAIQRKKQVRRQKMGLAGAALLMLTTICGGIVSCSNSTPQYKESDIIVLRTEREFSDSPIKKGIENFTFENLEDYVMDVFASNSILKTDYERLLDAVTRFSEELGEDALPLIKDRVMELGDGKVDVIDVLKILWIESKGRIYEKDNPDEILTSYTGQAFGPFQLTNDTVDYLNNYYGLKGTEDELDVMNPYDNLDACIYNLKFLFDKRQNDVLNGVSLPTGNNISEAVAWSYHDGAWASDISYYGQDYLEQYRTLSVIDEFPEVVEYLLG